MLVVDKPLKGILPPDRLPDGIWDLSRILSLHLPAWYTDDVLIFFYGIKSVGHKDIP